MPSEPTDTAESGADDTDDTDTVEPPTPCGTGVRTVSPEVLDVAALPDRLDIDVEKPLDLKPAGDVDGDGFADLLMTANELGDFIQVAASFVVYGGTVHDGPIADASVRMVGQFHGPLADEVAPMGDVDGDGTHDVLAAVRDGGAFDKGVAYVFLGPLGDAGGEVDSSSAIGSVAGGAADLGDYEIGDDPFVAGDPYETDGVSLAVMTSEGGAILIFAGPLDEPFDLGPRDAHTILDDGLPTDAYRAPLSVSDVTGDGVDDLVTGGEHRDAVEIFAGPLALGTYGPGDETYRIEGDVTRDFHTGHVLGDFTGDGETDILVLDDHEDDAFAHDTYLFQGPLDGDWPAWFAEASFTDAEGDSDSGPAVSIGDVDADGVDDWAFATNVLAGDSAGMAIAFGPLPEGAYTYGEVAALRIEGVEGFVGAGDVDGDCHADLAWFGTTLGHLGVLPGGEAW